MKRILGLTVAALLVMGLVGGGTWAYFSDPEATGTNAITAAEIDLELGGATVPMAIGPLKPNTSSDPDQTLTLTNSGDITADLTITLGTVANNENTRIEPEVGYDSTETDLSGELGGLITVAMWYDEGNDGWNTVNDFYLTDTDDTVVVWQTGESAVPSGAYYSLDDLSGKSFADCEAMAAADVDSFKISYDFPEGGVSDNAAQGDDCAFTITFELMQQ